MAELPSVEDWVSDLVENYLENVEELIELSVEEKIDLQKVTRELVYKRVVRKLKQFPWKGEEQTGNEWCVERHAEQWL